LPVVTALAELDFVPFRYVVEDAFVTVTFSPADVETVKPDVDTLLTVPTVPPAAGPDRALDPAPAFAVDPVFAALLLEPESAIAMTTTTTPITARPAAIDAVSLCLLKISRPRVMALHPFSVGAWFSLTSIVSRQEGIVVGWRATLSGYSRRRICVPVVGPPACGCRWP
jgi:hypothetical protein